MSTEDEIVLAEENVETVELSEDDDFGSFSDASFDDFEESTKFQPEMAINGPTMENENLIRINDEDLDNETVWRPKIAEIMNIINPTDQDNDNNTLEDTTQSLLNERSGSIYDQLTLFPHLRPPNWTKSKTRRHMLIKLGVPINLDEILPSTNTHSKKTSLSSLHDLYDFNIKTIDAYELSDEDQLSIIADSLVEIGKIEEYLQSDTYIKTLKNDELMAMIKTYKEHVTMLEEILAVWNHKQDKLQKDNETYESFVENLVGHTQRLRREEIMKKMKTQNKTKSRISFWKK